MTELSKKQTEQRASLGFQGDWHSGIPIRFDMVWQDQLPCPTFVNHLPTQAANLLSGSLQCFHCSWLVYKSDVASWRCSILSLSLHIFARFWTASISGSWFHLIWRVVGLFNNFWHADKLLEVLVDIWASGGSLELVLPILVEGIKEHSMCKMQRFVCRDQHSDLFSHFIPWWCLIHLMTQGRPLPCCRFSRCQNCSSHPYSMVSGDPLVDAQLLLSEATEPT